MNDIDTILSAVRRLAKADPALRQKLLGTKAAINPVSAFCSIVTGLGYPLGEMDLINAGEEYYANMRRSTNGGGENSPLLSGEDDYYEMFMAEL
jgi:hypothetical protein